MKHNLLLAAGLALLATACAKPADSAGKPAAVTEIQNGGSDTMLEVAGAWAEAFHTAHPELAVSVNGGGSGKGISSLINGTIDIANASRPMKEKEIAEADKRNHHPVQHKVGYDGVAIYVHKDNPIAQITLEQLKDVFGDGGKVGKWSDLGVKLANAKDDEIVLASRQNNSGTYECMRDVVLGGEKGSFKTNANNLNGSKDVVDFVARTPSAIGYSGIAYATPAVRMVPVVGKDGKAVAPSVDTVIDHSYPIWRPLFMYTSGEPKGAIKQYIDWVLSDAGQKVLAQKGYPPLRKV